MSTECSSEDTYTSDMIIHKDDAMKVLDITSKLVSFIQRLRYANNPDNHERT